MTIFNIHEINNETEALDVVDTLMKEAIIVSGATRGRQKKIRTLASKIEQVRKLSVLKKWSKPLEGLEQAFRMLDEASMEFESALGQLFRI